MGGTNFVCVGACMHACACVSGLLITNELNMID